MEIPKIIHYCWFGNGDKSELIKKCINSWKKYLVDYEIIEWNESNFDIHSNYYVEEAYKMKKYAFVSDYVRLYALKVYGGIYLDTDVELLKSLDDFLEYESVLGFESQNRISTATLFFKKNHPLIEEWIATYDKRHFIQNNKVDSSTNVSHLTKILKNKGLKLNGEYQIIQEDSIIIYPKEYFSPYSLGDKKIRRTEKTVCIHWCDGSWVSGKIAIKHNFIKFVKKVIGTSNYEFLKDKVLVYGKISKE